MKRKGRSGYIRSTASWARAARNALVRGVRRRVWDWGERARTLTSGHQGTFHRRRRVLCSYFFLPAALLRSSNVEALLSHPCYYYLSMPFPCPALALDSTRTGSSSRTNHHTRTKQISLFVYVMYCTQSTDTFLDQGSRSERYLQIKAHFEVWECIKMVCA